MISPEFLFGGKATFQVSNASKETYVFQVKRHKTESGLFFVSLKKDPYGEFSPSYIGYIKDSKGPILNKGQKGIDPNTKVVKVFNWAVNHVIKQNALPENYEITHVGKCGCCGKILTDDLSKSLGIGPVCLKHTKLDDRQQTILKLKALGF